jgi:chromosome segregation ATPase
LNGFWEDGTGRDNAETVWSAMKMFAELDDKGMEGNELDEFNSHRVLEKYDETLSVVKMREALRDIDQDANGKMSAIEYLIWRYKKGVEECVKSPQGDNQEEVDECQRMLAEVLAALHDVQEKLEAQKVALAAQEAAVAENNAKLREQEEAVAAADAIFQELKAAEDKVRAAEEELQAAVDALKAEEDAYNGKIAELETKSQDTSVGVVTRNKAANELQQLKAEDPLPLRRAKITAEAKVRPVTKAREAAEAKRIPAEEKKIELEAIAAQLAELQAQLEASYTDLQDKMAEAQAALDEAKAKGGVAHGNFWWMEREMYEADESLPRAKQKYDHSKPFEYNQG